MARTETHFEQVPLEQVAAITEAQKKRLAELETPQPSQERDEPQTRSERKGRR